MHRQVCYITLRQQPQLMHALARKQRKDQTNEAHLK